MYLPYITALCEVKTKRRVQRCDDASQVAGKYRTEQLLTKNQATVDPCIAPSC